MVLEDLAKTMVEICRNHGPDLIISKVLGQHSEGGRETAGGQIIWLWRLMDTDNTHQ